MWRRMSNRWAAAVLLCQDALPGMLPGRARAPCEAEAGDSHVAWRHLHGTCATVQHHSAHPTVHYKLTPPVYMTSLHPLFSQAQGEWTEEEHATFLETARAHGVGDKWGLFASYLPQVGLQTSMALSAPLHVGCWVHTACRLACRRGPACSCQPGHWLEPQHGTSVLCPLLPQRVGYQCSAYYRDVIIPQGLVIDRRFKMTRNGRAVYVG